MTDHISRLADGVFASVRGYIVRNLEPILSRLESIERRGLERGDKGERGEKGEKGDTGDRGADGADGLDGKNGRDGAPGKDGERGLDGKDASREGIDRAAVVAVEKAIALIPTPKDGADGKSIDPQEIEQMVQRSVAALPKPIDGKDADADAITEKVLEQVTRALEDIPVPKDGKDADPERIRDMVVVEVERAIAELPRPRDGIDGKSVAVEDLAPVVVTEVQKAVAEIPIPVNGKDADPELVRLEVLKAIEAIPKPADGHNGIDGRDGMEGEPGRDALQIDVLDCLDTEKRYPRGTYVAYQGGMIRSFRATDPVTEDGIEKSGWHVVVNGIADYDVALADDMRTLTMRTAYTNGRVIEKTARIPTTVHREVWREQEYEKGDAVTWDGSTWICRAERTTQKPKEGGDWFLAIKHGRNGRDGSRGEKGERGAEGRSGRDLTQISPDGGKY